MTKRELIDRITSVNRSATRDFLAEFSERDLNDYMHQLDCLGLTVTDENAPGGDISPQSSAARG